MPVTDTHATDITATAPGKIILCGEHSVVYGHPAIAVPVSDMRVRARVRSAGAGEGLRLRAPDIQETLRLQDAAADHPLGKAVHLLLEHLDVPEPDAVLTVTSELPIAAGMGSGAAVATATIRALAAYYEADVPPEAVSRMTFEVEKIHHGTPSGIDNTVIAWEKPVYFVKGKLPETFSIGAPFQLLIANSGIASSTREAITEVRRRVLTTPQYYNVVFTCIGAIAKAARAAVEQGALQALGTLLNENHELLNKIGVSLSELDALVEAARQSGALGAKLTGAGLGGNVIALVTQETIDAVERTLEKQGATRIWRARVAPPSEAPGH
jgi:mevalonate kinase